MRKSFVYSMAALLSLSLFCSSCIVVPQRGRPPGRAKYHHGHGRGHGHHYH